MRGWRAWLSDGSCLRSVDTKWEDLPDKGIVIIKKYLEPPYRDTMEYDHWLYVPELNDIFGVDDETMSFEEEIKKYPTAIVKRGMFLPDEQYNAIRMASYVEKDP